MDLIIFIVACVFSVLVGMNIGGTKAREEGNLEGYSEGYQKGFKDGCESVIEKARRNAVKISSFGR